MSAGVNGRASAGAAFSASAATAAKRYAFMNVTLASDGDPLGTERTLKRVVGMRRV
jgi:hypothetical protein